MPQPNTSYSALPHLRHGASEEEVLRGLDVLSQAKVSMVVQHNTQS